MRLGARARLRGLLELHGLTDAAPCIDIKNDGGPAGCRLPVEEDAAAAVAAAAAAADRIWQLRGGAPQQIRVLTLHAGASLASYQHLRLDGEPLDGSPADNNPLVDFYRTRDGRWFFMHGVLEHLAAGTGRVLGLRERSADAVRAAVAQWDAQALEDELARAGMCGAYARSADEWRAYPQGQVLAALPCVQVRRIGDAPPQPLPAGERPLSGVRVVDMTRIIAGPTASRTMAEHGADVPNISAQRVHHRLPRRVWRDGGAVASCHRGRQLGGARVAVADCDVDAAATRRGAAAGTTAARRPAAGERQRLRPPALLAARGAHEPHAAIVDLAGRAAGDARGRVAACHP